MTEQDTKGGTSDREDDEAAKSADEVAADDPQKTQKLAKAGDDIDPNGGQD